MIALHIRRLAVLAACVLVLASCGYDATPLPSAPASPAAEGADASESCSPEEAVPSYSPTGVTAGEATDQLSNSRRLVVGISTDSYLLGARDPFTGRFKGFDIDLAQRIARELGVQIELRVITADDRIPMLENGEIDVVVRNMTITCARWEQIAFSAEYYRAGQKVLVRDDAAEGYSGPQDLDGKVCAPSGTSSIDNIRRVAPDAEIVPAANHTACLVLFQQGEVDAITGDDTVLAGLAAQDPYAEVPDQDAFSEEPYGVGVAADNVALVRFVNGVIDQMIKDGSWQRSYERWFRPVLGPGSPPTPDYGRS